MTLISRRDLVIGAVGTPALLTVAGRAAGLGGEQLFTLGVASGEPSSDGMVLWTRLAPKPMQGDGGMPARAVPVRWEIHADAGLKRLVKAGQGIADPSLGHSVHVEVAGLEPGRPYWYRFVANGEASPVGRTRTAPAPGAAVDRLRFCYGSCQKYESGNYAAWRHAVADDPDLILFLGDYIYEGNPKPGSVRMHRNPEPTDLAGYRVRYATYRLDPLLQAAHAIAPWAVTWDDHEVQNNYAGALDEDNGDVAAFLKRRAAAYQTYFEFMPLRRTARPTGSSMHLYRTLDWGGLAQFQIIDDRQYRSGRSCQPPELLRDHKRSLDTTYDCADRTDPARSILGMPQETWLMDRLGRSRAGWNVLAQQTLMASYPQLDKKDPAAPPSRHSSDTWEGYAACRERVQRRWHDARTPNPLVISGDIHAFAATEHHLPDGTRVAAEFVGGSITSENHNALLKPAARLAGFAFAENEVRGYGRIDLTAKRAEVTFRGLANSADVNSSARDIARFSVEAGRSDIIADIPA